MCNTDLEVRYLQGMHELGVDCSLVYPRRTNVSVKEFKHRGGYKIIRFPVTFFKGSMGKEYSFKMLNYVKKQNPDLVHFHGIYGGGKLFFIRFFVLSSIYFKINNIPFFGWYHIGNNKQGRKERILSKIPIFKYLFHYLRKKPLELCTGITSINHSELNRLFNSKHPEYYGYRIKKTPFRVAPNTVNTKYFYEIDKNKAKEKIGLNGNYKYIIMVSRLFEQKGLHLVINIFPKLLKIYPNLHFLVIGEFIEEAQDYKKYIFNKIRKENMSEHITFLGRIEHHEGLNYYLNASEAFVLPTYMDSFAAVNIEAMACGIPIISTNREEIPYYLKPGVGILIPQKDEKALFAAIVKILSGDFIYDKNQQKEILDQYDYRKASKSLLDWYKEVLKSNE